MPNLKQNKRTGSVYVTVLGIAFIIAVMAMGAMAVQRTQRHMVARDLDMQRARLNALAGIEMGRLRVTQDSSWRTTYSNGVWEQDVTLADGTYTLSGTDPADGDLANDEMQPVTLTATGTAGGAVQKLAATFQPAIVPLDCLNAAVVADASIAFGSATFTCDRTVASNNNISAFFGDVYADVEAAGSVFGWKFHGNKTSGAESRQMPDPNTAFDYYTSHGTVIDVNDLPTSGDGSYIEDVVLSPQSNPYGGGVTNSQGIYVIDCKGLNVYIQYCRIVGTLVLLNTGGKTRVRYAVNWTPAVSNYPALLAQGDFELRFEQKKQLDEKKQDQNYNPAGTPYEGVEDDDKADTYPSHMTGLIYISGNCQWKKDTNITGVVLVGGGITGDGSATLTYSQTYLDNPPPGFYTLQLNPVPGSWHQVVN